MRFVKSAFLGIAFMLFGAALSAAEAAVVWGVSGTFSDGTTLTGSFSTDVYGYVGSANLLTQTKGVFTGFDYTLADSYSSSGLNFVDFQPGYTSDLHLQFCQSAHISQCGTTRLSMRYPIECRKALSAAMSRLVARHVI